MLQDLQREVDSFELPDLEAEYTEEEGDRLDDALDKYNQIRQSLAETQVLSKMWTPKVMIPSRPRQKRYASAGTSLTRMCRS